MMICFGISWPVSILKTIQVKNPLGKSVSFLLLVILGYWLGLANKICRHELNWVSWLYVVNSLMVAIDLILVLFYRRRQNTGEAL